MTLVAQRPLAIYGSCCFSHRQLAVITAVTKKLRYCYVHGSHPADSGSSEYEMSPTKRNQFMTPYSLLPLVTALSFGTACDTQNGPDYQGEPLADIVGTVSSSVPTPPSDLEAVLVWNNSAGTPDTVTGQSVTVDSSFPSSFHIEVFTPPPTEALNDYTAAGPGNPRIGVAFITALPPGLDLSGDEPDVPIAVSEDYMLVYVESDIAPGTWSAEFLGEPLSAGYYLMQVIDVDDPDCPHEIFDCLRVAPDGMSTNVPLIIANPEDIDIPEWT